MTWHCILLANHKTPGRAPDSQRIAHSSLLSSSGMSSDMGSMNHLQCRTISRSNAPDRRYVTDQCSSVVRERADGISPSLLNWERPEAPPATGAARRRPCPPQALAGDSEFALTGVRGTDLRDRFDSLPAPSGAARAHARPGTARAAEFARPASGPGGAQPSLLASSCHHWQPLAGAAGRGHSVAPGPKEASKLSGTVVSLILATLTGTVPFMLLMLRVMPVIRFQGQY